MAAAQESVPPRIWLFCRRRLTARALQLRPCPVLSTFPPLLLHRSPHAATAKKMGAPVRVLLLALTLAFFAAWVQAASTPP
jgi:hypothetical protein